MCLGKDSFCLQKESEGDYELETESEHLNRR